MPLTENHHGIWWGQLNNMQVPTFQTEVANGYVCPPPRSALYSLAPVGVGTPNCESLSSYINRLASAHSVSPKVLLRFVARKKLAEHKQLSYDYGLRTCNGFSKNSHSFSSRFIELTGQANLAYLTMLPWVPIFNPMGHGLLSKEKRWCPRCFFESHQKATILYEPLLWSLATVKTCPIHNINLINKCHHCQSKQSHFPNFGEIGFCGRCGIQLGPTEESYGIKPKRISKSLANDNNAWFETAIGEMIAFSVLLPDNFSASYLTNALKNLINKSFTNKPQMCRKLNVSFHTINNWFLGRCLPSFDIFLDVCYRLNITPVRFLLLHQPIPENLVYAPKKVWKNKHRYQEWERKEFETKLGRHLADANPLPLRRIAKIHGCGTSFLRFNWPELSQKISKRNKDYRLKRSKEKSKAALNATIHAYNNVKLKNGIVSKRKIYEELARLGGKLYGNNQKTFKLIQAVQIHFGNP